MCEKGVTTNTSLNKRKQLLRLGGKNALQFEMRQPFLGNPFFSQCNANDIATSSCHRAAISLVIDRLHPIYLQITL